MMRNATALLLGPLLLALAAAAWAQPSPKTLRVAFTGAETGFDPPQVSDVVSSAIVTSLFDAPLAYDPRPGPPRLVPNTATTLPEVSENHTRFVFRLTPGIRFADDPAFKGAPRELVAADYVYSVKRVYDPKTRSPVLFHFENAGLVGLSELRRRAIQSKQPFDYETDVAGIRELDRHSFEVRTAKPAPRLPYVFASPSLAGAVAREVIEAYPNAVQQHPVGTGPFVLAAWTRASRVVLERRPGYAHGVHPASGQALPLVDRVEIAIIEEAQPRWLAFLNGELDMLIVPPEFSTIAAPNGKLAPHLAKRGVALSRIVMPTTRHVYFGMENPVVGGYTPQRVALRRALSLAYDTKREIDLVRHGQLMPAASVMPPGVSGYDPALRSEMSEYDPARAKALLDLYDFTDKDGDGWRDQPDGSPLRLQMTTEPSQLSRQLQGLWKKAMDEVNVRIDFRAGAWPENIKASRAGKLMMWTTGWSAALPDGSYFLDQMYGPSKGQANHARFALPAFDALHERQRTLPDGAERDALIREALKISLAYMPYKASGHVVDSWITQSRVRGYVPHPFMRDFWRFVDVDREDPGRPGRIARPAPPA